MAMGECSVYGSLQAYSKVKCAAWPTSWRSPGADRLSSRWPKVNSRIWLAQYRQHYKYHPGYYYNYYNGVDKGKSLDILLKKKSEKAKLDTTSKKTQNKATLHLSPLTTLGHETRRAYSKAHERPRSTYPPRGKRHSPPQRVNKLPQPSLWTAKIQQQAISRILSSSGFSRMTQPHAVPSNQRSFEGGWRGGEGGLSKIPGNGVTANTYQHVNSTDLWPLSDKNRRCNDTAGCESAEKANAG